MIDLPEIDYEKARLDAATPEGRDMALAMLGRIQAIHGQAQKAIDTIERALADSRTTLS